MDLKNLNPFDNIKVRLQNKRSCAVVNHFRQQNLAAPDRNFLWLMMRYILSMTSSSFMVGYFGQVNQRVSFVDQDFFATIAKGIAQNPEHIPLLD